MRRELVAHCSSARPGKISPHRIAGIWLVRIGQQRIKNKNPLKPCTEQRTEHEGTRQFLTFRLSI